MLYLKLIKYLTVCFFVMSFATYPVLYLNKEGASILPEERASFIDKSALNNMLGYNIH